LEEFRVLLHKSHQVR